MVDKTSENTTFVVNETKRANSVELGKPGNRFKLYFEDADDLSKQIADLKATGLMEDFSKKSDTLGDE